ncbi:MAG: hypothetical protein OEV62_02375 [Actinomycetota bacterium]|nr:hypothetical protein [Actinomycetota bacterium]MDH5277680.1 hypothetical protein [Actinomycetota bacterium]
MTALPDLLSVGPPDPAERTVSPWRRRAARALGLLAVAVVAALALVQVGPIRWGSPDTGLTLVTSDGSGYLAVSVDTGEVVAVPSGRDLAGRVGPIRWLSTLGQDSRELFGAFPPWTGGREIVGAVGGGLLTLVGNSRVRRVQIWDVGYSGVTADLGTATDVIGVNEREALVSNGCLVLGCATTLLDLVDGSRTEVTAPPGFRLEDSALADDGTVALGVSREGGAVGDQVDRSVVVGRPGAWRVVDGLTEAGWEDLSWGPDGWLLVVRADGDVTVWRDGIDPLRVELPAGQRVLGISASPPGRAGGTGGR